MKWQPTKGPRRSRQQPRLEVGASLQVEIVDLNSRGEGVARHHGQVIFVPGVWLGEHAQIAITGLQKSYAQGRVEALVQAHQDRREPPCGVHGFDSEHCADWLPILVSLRWHTFRLLLCSKPSAILLPASSPIWWL